jgi:hypothetical protein
MIHVLGAPRARDFSSADNLQTATKLKQKLHYDEIHIPYHFESVLHYKKPLPCGDMDLANQNEKCGEKNHASMREGGEEREDTNHLDREEKWRAHQAKIRNHRRIVEFCDWVVCVPWKRVLDIHQD